MSEPEIIDLTDGEYDYDFSKWSKEVPTNSIISFNFDMGVSFDKKGNFQGFVDGSENIINKEKGSKILAKKRLKNL